MARPLQPLNLTLEKTSVTGRIKASWSWPKNSDGDSVEISWADNSGAWSSTKGPSTYKIDRKASSWYIDDLATGKTWYVRVRFIANNDYGPYSDTAKITLAGTTPVAPSGVKLAATDIKSRIKVTWNLNWSDAEQIEIGWSDSATAWASTAGYSSAKTDRKTKGWYIAGLTTGKTWYVRVRFIAGSTISAWSDMKSIKVPANVKKVATKQPTGITGTRDDDKVSFTWKIADENYGAAQWMAIKYSYTSWQFTEISKTRTSAAYNLPLTSYYPYTNRGLKKLWFAVRGRRANYKTEVNNITTEYYPQMSEWTIKEWEYTPPSRPTLTATLDAENASVFTWEVAANSKGKKPFADVEWQSILVRECLEKDGSKLSWKSSNSGWKTGTGKASGSVKIVEDTWTLAAASYTRWVRVRSRGCAGASEWRYAKHVYAKPKQAVIKTYSAKQNSAGGYTGSVKWTATANASHPIDRTTVEYALVVPAAGRNFPTGESWTLAGTSYDTLGNDAKVWPIDDSLDLDECLFYRVNTHHDSEETYGIPQLVRSGNLKDPTDITIEMPTSGYSPTIGAKNNSDVPDSFLVVIYRRKGKADMICGIIPHGSESVKVTCPNWDKESAISFGVYAAQGTYARSTRTDSVTQYTVTANMRSKGTIWGVGDVPKAPATVTLAEMSEKGKIQVNWAWSWANADTAEISWAESSDAWQSTAEPSSYSIDSKTTKWYIEGLEMGKRYYVRVRLINDDVIGPWSNAVSIDLASTPDKPILTLSDGIITKDGSVTASWTYVTRDDTPQSYAEICRATLSGSTVKYGNIIGHTETSQALILYAESVGWQAGEEYSLCVRTTSESGRTSAWSDPVTVRIAETLTAVISSTSLKTITITDDDGNTRTVTALTELPLTVKVTGAGTGGTTGISIERAESYHMDRPDENTFNGHEGESIAVITQTGEGQITVAQGDLIGILDDGAEYRIVATIEDGLGQTAEAQVEFEVHWSHQAIMPQATAYVDEEAYAAIITPIAPEGAISTDVCDIYRLSADKPELIVEDGIFGETYVDPYPAIGEFGGHRVVFKTANGDYITEDNQLAWIDLSGDDGDILDLDKTIIDFDGRRVLLSWNMALSSSWTKDFTETHYLGGSVQGDWNASVSRTGTVGAVAISAEDQELIKDMRRLAAYPGICHVRTPEGSSYAADVQVTEDMTYEEAAKLAAFSISITRVDPEGFDGVKLDEWESSEE